MPQVAINLRLHERQSFAFNSKANEILYGGAAGGGKSHLMRSLAIVMCTEIAGLQVYLFRRKRPDLIKNHVEGPRGFRNLLAPWVLAGLVKIVNDEIRFWNGSKIFMCHCKDAKDIYNYQGAEIHLLLIDELTHFTAEMYRFLRSRLRAPGLNVPEKYKGMVPRIICGTNPGNIGHSWVKAAFISPRPWGDIWLTDKDEGGMLRQFILAKLEDNPTMAEDDPGYADRLEGLGSPGLVKAMRYADWDAIAGGFFSDIFSRELHVVKPFELPQHLVKFRSFDWGSAAPFVNGWLTVADGRTMSNRFYPAGSIILFREWYGGKNGKGLKMKNGEIAKGIVRRTNEEIDYSVADPAIFAEDGGESIAETMKHNGVNFRPADNKRVAGWQRIIEMLKGREEKRPDLYIFETCTETIRTLAEVQHDETRIEDINTEGDDHAADMLRYAVMSRPYVRELAEQKPLRGTLEMTIEEAWKVSESKTSSFPRY